MSKIVAKTLRDLRVERKLSIGAVEEATGLNRATISQVERGRLLPTVEQLALICAALGVDPSRLAFRTMVVLEESR